MNSPRATFQKQERIVSRKLMEQLFSGDSRTMSAFPLKAVYMQTERSADCMPPVQILVSVPKKRFKHAADRNRAKRQVREAYRQHKQTLWAHIPQDRQLAVAFIWLSAEPMPSRRVTHSVVNLLQRMATQQ